MIQDTVLISSVVEGRTFMNTKEAFKIYTKLLEENHPYFRETRRVCNRLGLMYHKGCEHIAIDRDEAKAMYTRSMECEFPTPRETAIHTQRIKRYVQLGGLVWGAA